MLIDENELKRRNQLFEFINDVEHLDTSFDQIIGAVRKSTLQKIIQSILRQCNVYEGAGLFTISLSGGDLVGFGFENEFIEYRIEAPAFTLHICVATTDNVGVRFTHMPPDVLLSSVFRNPIQSFWRGGR